MEDSQKNNSKSGFFPSSKAININASWIFGSGLLGSAMAFGATLIVAKQLGPDSYGALQLVLASFGIIQVLENIIHPQIFRSTLIQHSNERQALVSSNFFLVFLISVVLILAFLGLGVLTQDSFYYLLAAMCLGLALRGTNAIIQNFDTFLESKIPSINNTVGKSSSAVVRIALALKYPSVGLQIAGHAFELIFTSLLQIRSHFKRFPEFRFSPQVATTKRLLKASLPWFAIALCSVVLLKIDQVMLGFLEPTTATLGIYGVAVRLSEPWVIAATALISSYLPLIMQWQKVSIKGYYGAMQRLYSILLLLSLAVGLGTTIFAPWVVPLIFGDAYSAVVPVLRIHIWSNVFLFWYLSTELWEVLEKKVKFRLARTLSAAAINITLNFILIPQFGAIGCAYATLISYFWAGFGFNAVNRGTRLILKTQLRGIMNLLRFRI